MGRIASTLEADFSDFVAETQKANVALSGLQKEAEETTTAADRTATSMGAIGKAAASSASGFKTLTTGLRTADQTLSAFGVQIGPQISALNEMSQIAGKTAAQIGKIGVATAAAGAALAGWQIGRKIAELTGADAAIADWTSTLMGWGSASAEAAGAQQDLINRARQFGYAGNEAAGAAAHMDRVVRANQETFNTGAARVKTWNRELHDAKADGLPGLRAEIEAGNSTIAEMSQHYGVSARAIQYLQTQMAGEATARREASSAAEAQAAALSDVHEAVSGASAILGTLADAERDATEAALAAGVSQSTIAKAYGLTAQQVKAVADAMKEAETAIKNYDAAQAIADEANRAWNDAVLERSATTTQALIADVERWRAEQIAALDETGGASEAHYARIEQIASEKLAEIKVDWDTVKEGSIAHYRDLAERAGATYEHMVANSERYTDAAIEDARELRDQTLATLEEIEAAKAGLSLADAARNKTFGEELKRFSEEAATAQQRAQEQQDRNMDRAIAYAQAYGVSLDEAQKKLGMVGDAGEQAGKRTEQAMAGAAQQVAQLTVIAQQSASQMDQLARHYQALAEENKRQAGGAAFWSPFDVAMDYERMAREYREKAGRRRQYESSVLGGEAWGGRGLTSTTTTLNVNVSTAEAATLAARLVTEMRHAGVRFG